MSEALDIKPGAFLNEYVSMASQGLQSVALSLFHALRVDFQAALLFALITPANLEALWLVMGTEHDLASLADDAKHCFVSVHNLCAEGQRLAVEGRGDDQAIHCVSRERALDHSATARHDLGSAIVDFDFGAQLIGV